MVVQIDSKNKSTQGLGRVVSTTAYQSLGCTDPTATNYNSGATVDDGSCCYTPGCTDPVASNYDAAACFNDGTCNYDVVGCMDINYQEYNSNANISDQQMCLTLITVGCTDASQTTSAYGVTYNTYYNYGNYDVTCTTCDNITAPNCCCLPHVPGCTNEGANNYDPTATINDGSCDNGIIFGCMDPTALNYTPNATNDSGGCCYYGGCTDATALNYNANACVDDGSCIPVVEGCTDATANNYDAAANTDNGTCTYNEGCTDNTAVNYDATAIIDDGSCCYNAGCTQSTASNYDPSACQEDGSCVWNGCTDPNYAEYDPTATFDDGTFCITLIVNGCTDPAAPNYDPAATVDDGSCGYFGCTDPTACNYDPSASGDDGSCILPDGCTDPNSSNYDPNATCDDGSCIPCVYGCTSIGQGYGNYNYDPNATCDDGSCSQGIVGCTDPTACNYDPTANNNHGCLYGADGCTDPNATNFDPNASCDDGSCVACVFGCMDPNQGGYDPNATCNDPSDCNYGYGGSTWTGANDDIDNWFVNGDNAINSIQNSNIYITKNSGNNNNGVYLNTLTYLSEALFRDTTTNWDGTKSYYMVQFDARTSPGDDVKMRIYADSPVSANVATSESIYYYGANNIYKTFYMFFEALPNGNGGPNNYSLRTTSFNTGETVYIKNIKVKQNKLDINNITSVNVNSTVYQSGYVPGKYFYFTNQSMEDLLGQSWSNGDTVDVIQVRNGLPIRAGQIKIWDYNSNNSTPGDASDIISNSHGRWDDGNPAVGDWQVGDKIILTLP